MDNPQKFLDGEEGYREKTKTLPKVRRSKRNSGTVINLNTSDVVGLRPAECEAPMLGSSMPVVNNVSESASEHVIVEPVTQTLVQVPYQTLADMLNAGIEVNANDTAALSALYEKIKSVLDKAEKNLEEEEEALLRSEDEGDMPSVSNMATQRDTPSVSNMATQRDMPSVSNVATQGDSLLANFTPETENLPSTSRQSDLAFLNSEHFTELVHAVSEQLGGSRSHLFPCTREGSNITTVRPLTELDFGGKDNIRRTYRLSASSRWDLWYDCLISELQAKGLRYIIERESFPPMPSGMLEQKKQAVRDIIINRIDDRFHTKVVNVMDPKEMLKTLETYKKREINVTSFNVRKRLNNLRYDPKKQTAAQFIEKFEDLIRNYENLDERHDLSEAEKTDAFFNAVKWGIPSLIEQQFNYRMLTEKSLTRDQIKSYMLQKEVTSAPPPPVKGKRENSKSEINTTTALLVTPSKVNKRKRFSRNSGSFSAPPRKFHKRNTKKNRNFSQAPQKGFKQKNSSSQHGQAVGRNVRCFNCQNRGHLGRDCTNPPRQNVCFRCNQEGHKAADCTVQFNQVNNQPQSQRPKKTNKPRTGLIPQGQAMMVRPAVEYYQGPADVSAFYPPAPSAQFVSQTSVSDVTYQVPQYAPPSSSIYGYGMTPPPVLTPMSPVAYGNFPRCPPVSPNYCLPACVSPAPWNGYNTSIPPPPNPHVIPPSAYMVRSPGAANVVPGNTDGKGFYAISFIIDSGATEHIVKDGEILTNMRKFFQHVNSANKTASLCVRAVGDIHVRDSQGVHMCLQNVLYAPALSENLFSIRKFTDNGFKVIFDRNTCRIYDPYLHKMCFEGHYRSPTWEITLRFVPPGTASKPKYTDSISQMYPLVTTSGDRPHRGFHISHLEGGLVSESSAENDGESGTGEVSTVSTPAVSQQNVRSGTSSAHENEKQFQPPRAKKSILDRVNMENTMKITGNKDDSNSESEDSENSENGNYRENSNQIANISEGMYWHNKLGHVSLTYLKQLSRKYTELKNVKFENDILNCEICILAKMAKLPFKEIRTRSDRPLQIIHSDVMGPIKPITHPNKKRFIVIFVDDYSRVAMAYAIKRKSEVGSCFETFLKNARNELGSDAKVCFLRTDQGTEFTGGKVKEILDREKISLQLAPPETPEHNGVAERFNRTLQNKVRSMMIDSRLPKTMWDLAVTAAVHVYNRMPHRSINYEIPFKRFVPNFELQLNSVRRFGCIAYVRVPKQMLVTVIRNLNEKPSDKFSQKGLRTIFVGYVFSGSLVYHPESDTLIESRHIRFNENLVYGDLYKTPESETNSSDSGKFDLFEPDDTEVSHSEEEVVRVPGKRGRPRKRILSEDDIPLSELFQTKSKKCVRRPNYDLRFQHNSAAFMSQREDEEALDEAIYLMLAEVCADPRSYAEAMASPQRAKWELAIKEELDSMKENCVWDIVDKPHVDRDGKRVNVIDSRWVFKVKKDTNGIDKYKARLVIRGFKDRNEYELKETYAPVARLYSVRTLLAIANKYDLNIIQMDVKTAFLNGVLERDIYMEIPDGVELELSDRKNKVCKLLRAIYGLRISPKCWNRKFTGVAESVGLKSDDKDPCLFTWHEGDRFITLLLYVDDMLLTGNDNRKIDDIIQQLCQVFKITILGEPKEFLGVEIIRDRKNRVMYLHQKTYAGKILKRFGMSECKIVSTPMVTRQVRNRKLKDFIEGKSSGSNSEQVLTKQTNKQKLFPYREAVGSLLYLTGATRPDISYAVNMISRNQENPTADDWAEVKRILRYLRGTLEKGLTFKGENEELTAYSDASFKDCIVTGRSTAGFVIRMFGDTVHWRCMKQKVVATSTCDAEYIAMGDTAKAVLAVQYIIERVLQKDVCCKLNCDNRSALDCIDTSGGPKLMHLSLKQHFIRSIRETGQIETSWVPSDEQWADIMTKPTSVRLLTGLSGGKDNAKTEILPPTSKNKLTTARTADTN
ncbi:hypothetical protein V9T40_011193 [Parthenolecanium corni]|uniref:Uncharacterized protein n=1 Tax=Parthenolecanium corni TaxID=536013 RepID=A0AAN9XY64_9HEMI